MALNSEQLKQAQALLDKINASYTKLGKTDPFRSFDLSKAKDFDNTIGQLNAGLNDVTTQLENMNSELDNIVSSFKLTVQEISKTNTALNTNKKTDDKNTVRFYTLHHPHKTIKGLKIGCNATQYPRTRTCHIVAISRPMIQIIQLKHRL